MPTDDLFSSMILIVEDEPLVAMLIEDAFVEAGYTVVLAANGETATKRLWTDNSRIAGVVTDIRMPGQVDGWEVARRARDLRPGIPIVYVTGDSMAEWRSHGVPGSTLFAKPRPPEDIVEAMTKLLGEHVTC